MIHDSSKNHDRIRRFSVSQHKKVKKLWITWYMWYSRVVFLNFFLPSAIFIKLKLNMWRLVIGYWSVWKLYPISVFEPQSTNDNFYTLSCYHRNSKVHKTLQIVTSLANIAYIEVLKFFTLNSFVTQLALSGNA